MLGIKKRVAYIQKKKKKRKRSYHQHAFLCTSLVSALYRHPFFHPPSSPLYLCISNSPPLRNFTTTTCTLSNPSTTRTRLCNSNSPRNTLRHSLPLDIPMRDGRLSNLCNQSLQSCKVEESACYRYDRWGRGTVICFSHCSWVRGGKG
jgi:hypothetical protein